ncbi:hypothetical protein [Salinimicrobium sp. HB62]|uniref:hypothetical protein n=1 Tax=Salinimicrobium sp. HB62 TaxID=3077781 RepID=UPI002D7692B1|nr:hypothetical protein [Salinimicrobium sp. HB62]
MQDKQQVPEENAPLQDNKDPKSRSEGRFITGLKKVGFNVWLAVMIIGGTLAFITALFLL